MNYKLILKLAGAATILTCLPACSTIVNGSNQSIAFNTGEVEGADCSLTGGSEFAVKESFVSPAKVEVPRSKKALQLACTKAGYESAEKTVNSRVEATTGGNLLIGGVIGAGVDAATGALYKYPETVVLEMVATGATVASVVKEEANEAMESSASEAE